MDMFTKDAARFRWLNEHVISVKKLERGVVLYWKGNPRLLPAVGQNLQDAVDEAMLTQALAGLGHRKSHELPK